ncbi:MAG: hypothetical protein IJ239_02515 [Eubacterium sp.]|nr:hypothetical protein [Eubacterium sp.]
MNYYIASCVFTSKYPELSFRIQNYIRTRFGDPAETAGDSKDTMNIVRCCVPKYKIQEFEERMPSEDAREKWRRLPDSGMFRTGDSVYSLCHNCNNIIDEMHPGVSVFSLWELIDRDDTFPFPDYQGQEVFVQDCWRSRDRADEQAAVRSLLKKMHFTIRETDANHGDTEFCGNSLYRPQPPRNPKLAPKHYVEGAAGKFIPHTEEEQKQIMKEYCDQFGNVPVVCYCHYCLEGLLLGGADGKHLAQLLF